MSGQGSRLQVSHARVATGMTATAESKKTERGVRIVEEGYVRRMTPLEWERCGGFPDGWTDVLPTPARYRTIGNAVVPNVTEWIGRHIIAVERDESSTA